MEDNYLTKEDFVKDFVKFCRDMKRGCKEGQKKPDFASISVVVCGEPWLFRIYLDADTVSTDAELMCQNGSACRYPRTTWGGKYARWDSELQEYLNREVCKAQ